MLLKNIQNLYGGITCSQIVHVFETDWFGLIANVNIRSYILLEMLVSDKVKYVTSEGNNTFEWW